MWKSNKYNNYDGLTPLLEMFENEDDFIAHFIEVARFFKPDAVLLQDQHLKEKLSNKEKIPVRFSMKVKENFHYMNEQTIKGTSKISFKNKKDAQAFAEQNDYFHNATKLKVVIDKDGNYYVREAIAEYAGFRVSQGAVSNVTNSMISHIWANTDNPLFFTALWNIAITPHYLSFILDKPDTNGIIVKRLKAIMEAVCYILYKPNELIGEKYFDLTHFESELNFAQALIDNDKIHFINYYNENEIHIDYSVVIENLYTAENELKGNKDFAYTLLEKLSQSGIDFADLFVDKEGTKMLCKMSYPILVDVTGDTKRGIEKKKRPVKSDVYYASPLFEFNDKKYLVCNDWKIHHKEAIVNWLEGEEG